MKLLLLLGFVLLSGALHLTTAQPTAEKDVVITITEYSDYQCPACGYFHPIVEKLKEKYGDQINLELKYFPLNSHRFAALAARAAEAAKNQGKFKEMHDLIFENQKRWSNSGNPAAIFVNFAEKLDLDMEQFREDLNSAETQKAVMEDKKEGKRRGVNSTPTFMIEGEKLSDLPRTFEEFDQIVQKYIEKKNSSE